LIDPVIADAGPIISFARAGKLGLLQQVIPRVILPPEVFKEVALDEPNRPGAQEISSGQWGELYTGSIDPAIVQQLPSTLHKGEREAVALALQLSRPCLADEKRVVQTARALGLTVVTSLRVLITAKQLGLISSVRVALDDLKKTSFRISQKLYDEILRLAGE
jgi:hypothetical protein